MASRAAWGKAPLRGADEQDLRAAYLLCSRILGPGASLAEHPWLCEWQGDPHCLCCPYAPWAGAPIQKASHWGPSWGPSSPLNGLQSSSESSAPLTDEGMEAAGRARLKVTVSRGPQSPGSGLGSVLCAPPSHRGFSLEAPDLTAASGRHPASHVQGCVWQKGPGAGFVPRPRGPHAAVARGNEDK